MKVKRILYNTKNKRQNDYLFMANYSLMPFQLGGRLFFAQVSLYFRLQLI